MWFVIYGVSCFIETIILFEFFNMFYPRTQNRQYYFWILAGTLLTYSALQMNVHFLQGIHGTVISLSMDIIVLMIVFSSGLLRAVHLYMIYYCVYVIMEVLAIGFSVYLTGYTFWQSPFTEDLQQFLIMVASRAGLILFVWLLHKFGADICQACRYATNKRLVIHTAILFIIITTIVTVSPGGDMTVSQIAAAVQISMIGFLLIILALLIQVRQKHQQYENSVAGEYLQMIENFRGELLDLHKKLAKQQHEIKHQVEYAEQLLAQNAVDSREKLEIPLKTGNVIVDTAIHAKSGEIGERITLNVQGTIPNALKFDTMDLVLIIMNLLENSIEACRDSEEHCTVDLSVSYNPNGSLVIEIKNPTQERKIGPMFYSSKKGLNHGFGLSIVYSLIDRYQGYYNTEIEDGQFIMKVLLQENQTEVTEDKISS